MDADLIELVCFERHNEPTSQMASRLAGFQEQAHLVGRVKEAWLSSAGAVRKDGGGNRIGLRVRRGACSWRMQTGVCIRNTIHKRSCGRARVAKYASPRSLLVAAAAAVAFLTDVSSAT